MIGFTKGHDQVQLIWVLERKLQGHDKGVVDQGKDSSLGQNVGDLTGTRRDVCLADSLESIDSLSILLADLHNLSEATLANDLEQIKGFNSQSLVSERLVVNFEMEGSGSGCSSVPLLRGVLNDD